MTQREGGQGKSKYGQTSLASYYYKPGDRQWWLGLVVANWTEMTDIYEVNTKTESHLSVISHWVDSDAFYWDERNTGEGADWEGRLWSWFWTQVYGTIQSSQIEISIKPSYMVYF